MQPILIELEIQAPASTVWQYLTEPEHITRWNFAHESWHCPHAESDLCVGGRFSYRMEAKDGSLGFDYSGIFDDIQPATQLDYHLDDGRTVHIELVQLDDTRTLFREFFEADSQQDMELQRNGWLSIAEHLRDECERSAA